MLVSMGATHTIDNSFNMSQDTSKNPFRSILNALAPDDSDSESDDGRVAVAALVGRGLPHAGRQWRVRVDHGFSGGADFLPPYHPLALGQLSGFRKTES